MSRPGHVYIMTAEETGHVKVGYSHHPEVRLTQIYGHGPLRLVQSSDLRSNAKAVERLAHRLLELADKRISGDWFTASIEEAAAAIGRAERIADGLEPEPTWPTRQGEWLHLRISADDVRVLDAIRRGEVDLPNRSQMVRRLIAWAAKARGLAEAERGDERAARR